MEENLPAGFRFHPTDEELITYYLTSKVSDFTFHSRAITEVDLNKCEPWDLPGKAQMGEKEWYFFSLKDRKYPTGMRTNRATDAGYWKTTGKDKEIFHSGVLVGMKKTLVFYLGRAPRGEKSNWVMHEYRLETRFSLKPIKEEWVVCRVFEKSSTGKKQQQTSSSPASRQSPCDTATMVNEHGGIELPNFNDLPDLDNDHNNNSAAINLNHNWVSAMEATNLPSFSWSSSLLGSNFSINSTLFRALPFSGYKPQGAMSNHHSYVQDGNSHFGADLSSSLMASSSKIMDSIQQQEYNDPGSNIW